jgi:cation diffusion facilitator family transporter
MINTNATHDHVFLGAGHAQAERRTWIVIALCAVMMVAEIVGGLLFGSIALVADGLHMSTHASALLLAALAYSYARRHAHDRRFTFGTGKLGDLAGFTSAIVLAMIALLIGYEAISRFIAPVPISFDEAIPIAVLGLAVNVASVLLLSGGGHDHGHGHGHDHGAHDHAHDEEHRIDVNGLVLWLSIFEDGVPPRFRLAAETGIRPRARAATIETLRPGGALQVFALEAVGDTCSRSMRFPSRTPSRLSCVSQRTPSPAVWCLRNMRTVPAPPIATTICAVPSSTCSLTRLCRCW